MLKIKTDQKGIHDLILLLKEDYKVIGPKIEAGAQVFGEISGIQDFPIGLEDHHQPGKYELRSNQTKSLFQVLSGPQSAKNFLFPGKRKLFSMIKKGKTGFEIIDDSTSVAPTKLALIGLRACELAAMGIQDKVFTSQKFQDDYYKELRNQALIIAINCTRHNASCFCTSMGGSPLVKSAFDLRITEILNSALSGATPAPFPTSAPNRSSIDEPWYLIESGTSTGEALLEKVFSHTLAEKVDIQSAHSLIEKNTKDIPNRNLPKDIKNLLYKEENNSLWEDIAQKCLACANCTMVCPTCFCSTVEEVNDVSGNHSERWLKWESCFTSEHSLMHRKPHRQTISSRYRQWMTHKLASWQDQFGTSGCTGCGKCITWCPVGIDITYELHRINDNQSES